MWQQPRLYFGVRKGRDPIGKTHLKGGVNPGITYNMSYVLWDAAIAAGASIDDLWRMEMGVYPKELLAKIVAWRRASVAIDNHTQVAVSDAAKKKAKKRG